MKEPLQRTTLCRVIEFDEDHKEVVIVTSDESEGPGFILDGNYAIDFCPEPARREDGIFRVDEYRRETEGGVEYILRSRALDAEEEQRARHEHTWPNMDG